MVSKGKQTYREDQGHETRSGMGSTVLFDKARYPVFALSEGQIVYQNIEALKWKDLADKVIQLSGSKVPPSGQVIEAEGFRWRVLEWGEVGNLRFFLCADTSERENQQLEVEKLIRQLAHEFRTPLNSMLGFTELMLEETDDEAHREYLTAILRAGESLVSMLTQVLDYGRIAAGKFVEEAAPVEMEMFAELLRFFFLPQARRSNLDFRVVVAEDVPPLLIFDAGRVRLILFNLISNALKYTSQGGVKVDLKVDQIESDQVWVRWEITDTGSGLPSYFMNNERVGEYERGRRDIALSASAGLGLSIALGMAQALGGKVDFQPGDPEGTKAFFTFAAKKYIAAGETLPLDMRGLKGRSILVADELGVSRERIRQWIEWAGGNPVGMNSLAEAIGYARHNPVDALVAVINPIQLESFRELLLQLKSYPLAEIRPSVGVLPYGENRPEILSVFDQVFYQPLNARGFIEKLSELLSPAGAPGLWDEASLSAALADIPAPALEEIRMLTCKYTSPVAGFHDPDQEKIFVDKLLNWAVRHDLKSFINFGKTLLKLWNHFEVDAFEFHKNTLHKILNSEPSNPSAYE